VLRRTTACCHRSVYGSDRSLPVYMPYGLPSFPSDQRRQVQPSNALKRAQPDNFEHNSRTRNSLVLPTVNKQAQVPTNTTSATGTDAQPLGRLTGGQSAQATAPGPRVPAPTRSNNSFTNHIAPIGSQVVMDHLHHCLAACHLPRSPGLARLRSVRSTRKHAWSAYQVRSVRKEKHRRQHHFRWLFS
jgi:hypothetical protein